MNIWGFRPTIFNEPEKDFRLFLHNNKDNILKAEFYISSVIDSVIKQKN